eukprot:XP_019922731.1 PREDICTED: uncharacterized protein LOC105328194 [Crassostrea gigas]
MTVCFGMEQAAMKHLIFVLVISSVFAQNHPEQTQVVDQAFQSLDLHPKDGVLEKNELTAIFTERDTDGNGKLVYSDMDNLMQREVFNYLDTNTDGFLTKVELVDNTYKAMDINGDNQVTKNEFSHYYLNLIQHLQQAQLGR